MATLTERLESDYLAAMKAGQRLRIDTLRLVKAGIQRLAIEKQKKSLEDPDVIHVLQREAKQRRETLEAAKQSNRQDILAQTTEELAILNSYLPQPMSDDAIRRLIEDAIKTVGPQQGAIMKHVMSKASGAADGKLVSQLVMERLNKGA
jgi:uncharacterized protein YqeY